MNISSQNVDSNNQLVQFPSYHNLLNFYKPNFVLVKEKKSMFSTSIFDGILLTYGYNRNLPSLITSSKKHTLEIYPLGRVFMVCLTSVIQQILNSVAYQGYLFLLASLEEISLLPKKKVELQKNITNFLDILKKEQVRELWWVNLKTQTIEKIKKLKNLTSSFFLTVQKIYLNILISITLFVFNIYYLHLFINQINL